MNESLASINSKKIDSSKLSSSAFKKKMNKYRVIAEYWHSIPTEDDIRCELQLDHQQWEKNKHRYLK